MGIKASQLRELIVRPTLKRMEMWDKNAENLVMGTAAQESHLGHWLKQITGPAVGIYQMEPKTYYDVIKIVIPKIRKHNRFLENYDFYRDHDDIIYDLQLATIMCRLQYWRFEEKLPKYNDVHGLAEYWKKYYNTTSGKGKVQDFEHNYKLTED